MSADFISRAVSRYNDKNSKVNPERAIRLIHGDSEAVDTSELDDEINKVYDHLAPSRFPDYKGQKLRRSIAGLLPRYGVEALLKLSDEDVNHRGEIKESSLPNIQ